MATIKFKAKVRDVWDATGTTVDFRIVDVPDLTRKHCAMDEFRRHPKYGSYANSDLFPAMLRRIKMAITKPGGWIKLDDLPDNVTVDASGFLAIVKIEV